MGEGKDLRDSSPTVYQALRQRGVSRRDFMKFCSLMAATLALPASFAPKIAEALEKAKRPSLVWLEFQDCCGNTESFLRASNPTVVDIVLDVLSVDYHETIMAPAGKDAEKSLQDVVKNQKGKYICVVEGAIPTRDGGVYCCVGGRAAIDIAKEVCGNSLATIAMGACAWDGGIPSANPNPTGAVGVKDVISGVPIINLPGCPANVVNLTGTVVHYLTFGSLPLTDNNGAPLFGYGTRIHDACQRRAHYDAGRYVRQWGDEGHRNGWCLYYMGCKGPETYKNCPTALWNDRTSWPVGAGHNCIGCASPKFWDTMTPFYSRLASIPGFGVESTADKVGLGLAIATAAGVTAHAIARAGRKHIRHEDEEKTAKTEDK
ncbi:MAG: hydrogenase small subunit [Nitrospiraceae bacterium]|nr:hydrogenase small subunit [Nitrospiraceae bacterium]